MYRSKQHSQNISIPKNYSGNTFRVIDESDRAYISAPAPEAEPTVTSEAQERDRPAEAAEREVSPASAQIPFISSLLSGISVEDILILGIIFVIHEENPNDSTLLLLLILLLAK